MLVFLMLNIFTLPRYGQINTKITSLRYFLACYVVFVHIFPWYIKYSGTNYLLSYFNLEYLLYLVNLNLTKVFQPAYETNPAVLAFITLSGYCIHRNGLRLDNFDFSKYFKRRFFRIYPLFFIAAIFSAFIFQYFNTAVTQTITSTKEITWYAILIKIFGLNSFSHKLASVAYQANAPLLTVGVEIWLYIIYPLFLMLYHRMGNKKFLVLLIANHLFWCLIISFKPSYANWWHNSSLFGFIVYWYLGVYFVDKEFNKKVAKYTKYLVISFVLLTACLIFLTKSIFIVELKKILFCTLFCLLLNKIDANTAASINPVKSRLATIFTDLKESSYSLYAIHVPMIVVCINLKINVFIAIGIILTAGLISYKLIEEPCTKFSKNYFKSDLVFRLS